MNTTRRCPTSPRAARRASAAPASTSPSTRRARPTNTAPAAVVLAPRATRSNSTTPNSRSNAAICRDSGGWAIPSASAARPKCPCSATATA
ncbi:hypothetical protein DFQ13_11645 [Actinokineospora spheciospongiae]|nr:hypothetical protein DFQ13_11645 [Actinokineospora spheciospongiae]